MGLFDKISKAAENIVDSVGVQKPNEADEVGKTIHDLFTPSVGGGNSFAFKEDVLICGNDEYPYSQVQKIELDSLPSSPLLNGVLMATFTNGKFKSLAFNSTQIKRLLKAYKYVTERLLEVNSGGVDHKFLLMTSNGSTVKIYEHYADLHCLGSTFGKGQSILMQFRELSMQLSGDNRSIIITHQGQTYSLEIEQDDIKLAEDILSYIETQKQTSNSGMGYPTLAKDTWKNEEGVGREFTLSGQIITVSEAMDIHNSYRLKFYKLAKECVECAKSEYMQRIRDLKTFILFFDKINQYYRGILCDKAMEVIVASGIWTETRESFEKEYNTRYNEASTIMAVIGNQIAEIKQEKQETISNIMSLVPNVSGGGFGLKGAVKGIASATAFNIVRDTIEASAVAGVNNISEEEQAQLYEGVKSQLANLFDLMFDDYFRCYLLVVRILEKNRVSIWSFDNQKIKEFDNIFQNMSNPNFPQEKALEIIISLLGQNPYNVEYHKYIRDKFGVTEEVEAIGKYFGIDVI